jgi:plasmid stability protein
MKNITVSLDDDVYRRARICAAERDTSVSAMVRQFLVQLASEESETERLKREEARLRDSIQSFRAADRVGRDELHQRRR